MHPDFNVSGSQSTQGTNNKSKETNTFISKKRSIDPSSEGTGSTSDTHKNNQEDNLLLNKTDTHLQEDLDKLKNASLNPGKINISFMRSLLGEETTNHIPTPPPIPQETAPLPKKISGSRTNTLQSEITDSKITPDQSILNAWDNVHSSNSISALKQESNAIKTNTHDDAQQVNVVQDNFTEVIKSSFSKLASGLHEKVTFSNDKIYAKAENAARQMVENAPPDSALIMSLTLRTDKEIYNDITKSVFGMKGKYQEKFDKLMNGYQEKVKLNNDIRAKRSELYKAEKAGDQPALEKLTQELKVMYTKLDPSLDTSDIKGMQPVKLTKPSLYDALPGNKQALVDKIYDGIMSVKLPNEITDSEFVDNAGPDKSKELVIPKEINFHGKVYTNIKELGAGGDGVAFLMQAKDGSKVVVKSAFDSSMSTVRDNIVSEIKTHQHAQGEDSQNNQHVLGLYGAIKTGNILYTVTEFAEGGDLTHVTAKVDKSVTKGQISGETDNLIKRSLLRDTMQAMRYVITERNMMHHDMKTDNIFVRKDGSAVSADFGRAKTNHKGVNDIESTPAYLAPEAAKNSTGNANEKADVFSLGMVMKQVLLGINPDDLDQGLITRPDGALSSGEILINAMIDPDPAKRPNMTTIANHSFFNDPVLNEPSVKEILQELIKPESEQNPEKIKNLNEGLDQVNSATAIRKLQDSETALKNNPAYQNKRKEIDELKEQLAVAKKSNNNEAVTKISELLAKKLDS